MPKNKKKISSLIFVKLFRDKDFIPLLQFRTECDTKRRILSNLSVIDFFSKKQGSKGSDVTRIILIEMFSDT